jgi:hypothetical protein
MNTDALFLFLILLLGLVFCSVLGGNCGAEGFDSGNSDGTSGTSSTSTNGASTSGAVNYDNYNHYSGSSTQLANGTTFYGKNGGYVVVSSNQDGSQGLRVVVAGGAKPISFSSQSQPAQSQPMQSQPMQSQPAQSQPMQSQTGDNSSATFYGPNGASATVAMNANGQQSIQVQTASGSYDFSSGYGQPDSNAVATSSDSVTSTQYYGSTGSPVQLSGYSLAYQGTGGSANPSTMSPPSTMSAPSTAYDYSSSLPQGIPASQIPRGQEDMYILKSEIVPPVCPACPSSSACPRQEKCPPCPACARCPEPSFECKKVPNYSAINNDYLPSPVLNDFSSFGM